MSLPLVPGTRLSHYEILSQLGAGGMGEVYLAHDAKLDRKVALKIQPIDGGPARQITNFKSDRILTFAYSRDGRQLALARGSRASDAVLISSGK